MQNSIKGIRTIALVGQAGSGKTTLAECLLAKAGAVHAAGSVERGTTICDYAPGEKQLHHSLKLAVASFESKLNGETTRIHLLDTPGYPDFAGHALPALAAVETAAIVTTEANTEMAAVHHRAPVLRIGGQPIAAEIRRGVPWVNAETPLPTMRDETGKMRRVSARDWWEGVYKRWKTLDDFRTALFIQNFQGYIPIMSKANAEQNELSFVGHHASQFEILDLLTPEEYAAKERRLLWKIDLRLMPILFLIIVLK